MNPRWRWRCGAALLAGSAAAVLTAALPLFFIVSDRLVGPSDFVDALVPIALFPGWFIAMGITASASPPLNRADFMVLGLWCQCAILWAALFVVLFFWRRRLLDVLRRLFTPSMVAAAVCGVCTALFLFVAARCGVPPRAVQPGALIVHALWQDSGMSLVRTRLAEAAIWVVEWALLSTVCFVVTRRVGVSRQADVE